MKRIGFGFFIVLLVILTSCKGENSREAKDTEKKALEDAENVSSKETLKPIIENYLVLVDALVDDSGKEAAEAGKNLLAALKEFDNPVIASQQGDDFVDIMEDAEVNAEHISVNADHIHHQREHMDFLSRDVNDLIEMFGAPESLYRIFCQNYNENKGAYWISDKKDGKNPYGPDFESCGEVQKEY